MLIHISIIQKMIKKALIYRFLTNFDAEVKKRASGLTHSSLSVGTGRASSWFNNSFNQLEDLQISSFLRILASANQQFTDKEKIDEAFLAAVFSSEVINIAAAANNLTGEEDAHLPKFIQSEKELFRDLIGYWAILSSKNKLNNIEKETLKKVRTVLQKSNNIEQGENNE